MIDHRPFEKTGSGKHAVLLLHGIASSPGHFRNLVPGIPESFSIYNILLDGHNGTVEAFGHTSMAKWKAQVKATLCDLFSKHDKVVIVAHSMGHRPPGPSPLPVSAGCTYPAMGAVFHHLYSAAGSLWKDRSCRCCHAQ